jgi:hypothetical protein
MSNKNTEIIKIILDTLALRYECTSHSTSKA